MEEKEAFKCEFCKKKCDVKDRINHRMICQYKQNNSNSKNDDGNPSNKNRITLGNSIKNKSHQNHNRFSKTLFNENNSALPLIHNKTRNDTLLKKKNPFFNNMGINLPKIGKEINEIKEEEKAEEIFDEESKESENKNIKDIKELEELKEELKKQIC